MAETTQQRHLRITERLEAQQARLAVLQPTLGEVAAKADVVFEEVFFRAPHPSWVVGSPVFATASLNYSPIERQPYSRSVHIRGAADEAISLSKLVGGTCGTSVLETVYTRPDGELDRRVLVRSVSSGGATHDHDIEVYRWDNSTVTHKGFIGYGYVDHDKDIERIKEALDAARQISAETLDYDIDNLPELRSDKDQITLELARVNPRPAYFGGPMEL